ncbi:uncharacterized protein LOC125499874 isoform X2 [Athalia rosae]|nr:uncharacterized protein LOC125499874 isoform X2 [Athalia rosae]
MQQDENKKLSRLVLLIDQYLDWFEKYRIGYEEQCSWYGACIVDLLDSYLSSSYNLVATHDGPLVNLSGRYVIKGQSEIPPKISEPLGGPITQKELLQVLRYIRKHARWSNFVNSFRNEPENCSESEEEDSEEVITTDNKEDGYQRSYRRNNSKNFNDSYDENVESLTVMVNLICERSRGPIRLRGGFEEMNSWRKGLEFLTREINSNHPSLAENLSIISNTNDSNLSLKSKLHQLKSIRESAAAATRESPANNSKTSLHHKYVFNLEIKSIHPAKNDANISAGEKFGETMLHISHTSQHTFGAQTECSLY